MKLKRILLCFMMSTALFGCASSEPLISESKAETQSKTESSMESNSEDANINESTISDKTVLSDWSNWADGSLSYPYGSALNLFADTNGTLMFDGTTKALDGTLSIYTAYALQLENYPYEGEADMVMLVAVNDVLCEFNLNGEQSKNGLLTVQRSVNTDIVESLTMNDCNLVVGENEVSVYIAVYFPQIGHVTINSLSRPFQSDTEQTQSHTVTLDVAELSGVTSITINQVDEQERDNLMSESSDFIYEQISFDSSKRCTTIAPDGIASYHFVNKRFDSVPEQRNAICLVLHNGKLIPAWNGSELLEIPFTNEDISINLPFECEMKEGDYSFLTYVFFDFDDDSGLMYSERLFYVNSD